MIERIGLNGVIEVVCWTAILVAWIFVGGLNLSKEKIEKRTFFLAWFTLVASIACNILNYLMPMHQ